MSKIYLIDGWGNKQAERHGSKDYGRYRSIYGYRKNAGIRSQYSIQIVNVL